MLTFLASPERQKELLRARHEVAQNATCERIQCRRKWKDHFAGDSRTINQGACPFQWEDRIVESKK